MEFSIENLPALLAKKYSFRLDESANYLYNIKTIKNVKVEWLLLVLLGETDDLR